MKAFPGMQFGGYTILYQISSNEAIAKCNGCDSIRKIILSNVYNISYCSLCAQRKLLKLYEYNGEQYTIKEIAKLANCSVQAARGRLYAGYSTKDIIEKHFEKHIQKKLYEYNGELYTIDQLAELAGCKSNTFYSRLYKNNFSIEKAINMDFSKTKNQAKLYKYKGKEYTITELAELTGCNRSTIGNRIARGLSIEEAVKNHSLRKNKLYKYKDEEYTIKELAELAGCKKDTFYARIRNGFTIEEAVAMGPSQRQRED